MNDTIARTSTIAERRTSASSTARFARVRAAFASRSFGLATLALVACLAGGTSAYAGECEAHFTFDGHLQDSSGNAYHGLRIDESGEPLGDGVFQAGKFGQALRLDGTSAIVTPVDLHWNVCPKVTIAMWVIRNALPESHGYLLSTGYGAGPKLRANLNRVGVYGGGAQGSAMNAAEPGEWTPLVGTWDFEAGELTLHWPDGTLTEPFRSYTRPPQPELWIGGNGYFHSVNGIANEMLVDDVRVWGRVLSEDEIAATLAGNPPEVARCPCGPEAPPAPAPIAPGPTEEEEGGEEWTPEYPDPRVDPNDPARKLSELNDIPEPPPSEYDPEPYLQQRRDEYERNFGPRDRGQVVMARGAKLAYASVPGAYVAGEGARGGMNSKLNAWLSHGKQIREMFRINGTEAIVAVADNGTVIVDGDAQGRDTAMVAKIDEIRNNQRPIDLVADRSGGYVIISGTNVYGHQVPAAAVAWAQQEVATAQQVTALAFLGPSAWIGVSKRGVGSGGLPQGHWGLELLDDVQRLVDAGEVVQDIGVAAATVVQHWAIATDKRVFVRGFDCRDLVSFGAQVESELSRDWDCEVRLRHCLDNRDTWSETDMGSDPDPDVWELNVLVTIGIGKYQDEEKEEFDCWLENQLRRAELLFDDTPRMKLNLRTQRRTRVDGVDLPNYWQESTGEHASFMDRNFDIMAKSKTEGYFQILIVNEICIGYDEDDDPHCIGGRATFPHVVDPFTRKHGIIMKYPDDRDWVMAHEFGHYLALLHTFDKHKCNDVYSHDKSNNQCNSCKGTINSTAETCSSLYNVMDYCGGDNDDVRINACQRARSANQRERYLTDDGRTHYHRMKGRLGEPYCTEDEHCLDDEYCNKGVATVGRNVCKDLLPDGATCSRSKQCLSGNCSVFKCK